MSDNQEINSTNVDNNNKKRHRGLRITLISLGSLLGLVVIVCCVACWLIFTPARLTAIVNKLSGRFITCQSSFEKVDLTLFKTFPNVGLDVHNVKLVNPMPGAPNDTLASIGDVTIGINLRAYLKEKNVIVNQVKIDETRANLYIDSLGRNNFTVFVTGDTTKKDTTSVMPSTISVEKVKISDFYCSYIDQKNRMNARVADLDMNVKGNWRQSVLDAAVKMGAENIILHMRDSVNRESLAANLHNVDMNLDVQGAMSDLQGRLAMALPKGDIAMGGMQYVNDNLKAERKDLLKVDAPFHANLNDKQFTLSDATLALARFAMTVDGDVALAKTDTAGNELTPMKVDARLATDGSWPVKELISILPARFTTWSKGMNVDADVSLDATAQGVVADSTLPLITARVTMQDGSFADKKMLPYKVTKIQGDMNAVVDLSAKDARPSTLKINSLSAKAAHSKVSLTGNIQDLLNNFLANLRLQGDLQLKDIAPFLPDTMPLQAKGSAKVDVKMKTTLKQLTSVDLKHMRVDGSVNLKKLDVLYDSISAQSPALRLAFKIEPAMKQRLPHQLLQATITGGNLKADVMSSNLNANLDNIKLDAVISDIMDSTVPFALACNFDLGKLEGKLDSLLANIVEPVGTFTMQPGAKSKVDYTINYNSGAIHVNVDDSTSMDLAGLTIKGNAHFDSTQTNVLAKWSPNLDVDFKLGYLHSSRLPYVLQIPNIKFNYKPEKCEINSANVIFGNSDYYLSGAITGLEKWLSHEAMLKGDLNFTSNFTNVDDLMDVFSGMGTDKDTLAQQRKEDNVAKEAHPFIVPRDVDFTLHTRIKEAIAFENDLQELAGDVRVKDGVAVLDQVGFVCKAARMQLTAMYRTPRVNHIFCGLDFHLLDININELINMIPMVDTLVPMLSSFDGHANFHLAAETYLNAFYQPKMSTLRGAANINGDSLVVLDNETFNTISKYLLFNKKTRNVIDSLDVEMTAFRREVEVYPFLLKLDKYQLCAAGRHNLDNNYDYHLEVLKSPLPMRLALDVKGVMPKLNFKLSKCRYAELYKPEKRNDVQAQTLELKNLIRKSLESNVKETTRSYKGLEDGSNVEGN